MPNRLLKICISFLSRAKLRTKRETFPSSSVPPKIFNHLSPRCARELSCRQLGAAGLLRVEHSLMLRWGAGAAAEHTCR